MPALHASAVGAATIVKAGEELKVVFSSVRTASGKTFVAKLVNSEGAVVETVVAEPTLKATLQKFTPSQISQEFKAAQSQAPAGAFSLPKLMGQKLVSFPAESMGFFMALGAVVTYELMFNETQNPVAYEQLAQSQMDPVGQLSFYFFMVANGAAAEPLMTAVQNGKLHPRLGPFIPFLGMGLGSVASNIVNELGHAPELHKCVKVLISAGGLDSSCDKAWQSWVERGGVTGIANEWSPGLISLLGSTILSGGVMSSFELVKYQLIKRGVIEISFRSAAQWTGGQIIKVAGFEVATLFVPGGIVVKGIRVISFVAQLAIFSGIDSLIRNPILFAYKNAWDLGPDLRDAEQQLISDLLRMKRDRWAQSKTEDLDFQLQKFSKLMSSWRQTNLQPVLEAQSNWEQKIGQLSLGYKGSKAFYSNFLEHLWQRKFGKYREAYASHQEVRLVDRIFPLNGITTTGLDLARPEVFSEAPDIVEDAQLATINTVLSNSRSGKLFVSSAGIETSDRLLAADLSKLNEILNGLKSPDKRLIGQAVDQMNCQLFFNLDKTTDCRHPLAEKPLNKYLQALRTALGDPRPQWQPGIGYLKIFATAPENKSFIQNATHQAAWSLIATPGFSESMVASMAFGPDAERGEALVLSDSGFMANFRAPSIRKDAELKMIRPTGPNAPMVMSIFNTPVSVSEKAGASYPNTYSYLNSENIRPTVFNSDQKSFSKWWGKNAETSYVNAWVDFEEKYQEIVSQLVHKLWSRDVSFWNRGPISNGIIASIRQENHLYIMILGELMKDQSILESGSIEPSLLGAQSLVNLSNIKFEQSHPQLFSLLAQNTNLQFSMFMKMQKIAVAPALSHLDNANFNWQNKLLSELLGLEKTIYQIKPISLRKSDGRTLQITKTAVSNSEIKQQIDQIQSDIQAAKSQYFSLAQEGSRPAGFSYTAYQKRVIDACFHGLEANLSELANIGLIANSVSYVERHDVNGLTNPRCIKALGNGGATNRGVHFVQEQVAGCE